jgi:hypothetical protein
MTWQVGPTMLPCRWHGMPTGMLTSCLRHDDIIIIWVWHVGRVNWYSGRVIPSRWRRCLTRVGRVCARGQSPRWRVTAREDVFDVVFTSGFVSSSSTQWYGQNTILTTFIFEQKSNTTLYHVLWYQLLGIPAPICADRWCTDSCSKEAKDTDTIFNVVRQNCLHPRKRFILLEIEKGYNTNKWRRRITSLYSTPSPHCCTCSCCNDSKAVAIAALHFLSTLLHTLTTLSHGSTLLVCLFIGKNGGCINGGSTWVAPFCQWLVQLLL